MLRILARSCLPALCCLVLLCQAGCTGKTEREPADGPAGQGEPCDGGTAVVAISSEPDVLNSVIKTSTVAGIILAELQDALMEMAEDLTMEGRIAESWHLAPDSLSITFRHDHPG